MLSMDNNAVVDLDIRLAGHTIAANLSQLYEKRKQGYGAVQEQARCMEPVSTHIHEAR